MRIEIPEIFWHGNRQRVMSIDFFPNSVLLISCGPEDEDRLYIKYWRIEDRSKAILQKKEEPKPELTEFERKILGKDDKSDPELQNRFYPEFLYNLSGVHTATVNVVRFSPNGQYLATGSDDIF